MTEVLNLHDNIIFMPEKFNANTAWLSSGAGGVNTSPVEKFFTDFKAYYTRWRDASDGGQIDPFFAGAPPKQFTKVRVVGLKVRPSQAGLFPGTPQWGVLERVHPKLICSYRRNMVKSAISEARAKALYQYCGTFNLRPDTNCSLPANWTLPASELPNWIKRRIKTQQALLDLCAQAAQHFNVLYIAYEDLLADAAGSMDTILNYLGFGPEQRLSYALGIQSLPVAIQKNTPDNLSSTFSPQDLDELKAAAQALYANMTLDMFD
jgi:hypothetical protein